MELRSSATRSYSAGEVVFDQGDVGDAMYVIDSGRVDIFRTKGGRELKLASLGRGEYFGEMALLLDSVRSASARAASEAVLSVIDKMTFKELSVSDPVVWRLMSEMGQRIQDVDSRLDDFLLRDEKRTESLGDFIATRQSFY